MEKNKPLLYMGMLAVIVAIVLYIAKWSDAGWIFSTGAIMILLHRTFLMKDSKSEDITTKRLIKIHFFSGLILLVAAYLMLIGKTDWKGLIAVFAALDIYVAFRMKKK